MDGHNQLALPSLAGLGKDLLVVSRGEATLSIARPVFCFLLFWILALAHHHVLACVAAAGLMFFTYTSTSHDLVHRTLHFPIALNECLLAALEGICLRSGHAFRLTHLQHHKLFPQDDDIEGKDAAKGFWQALAEGLTSLQQTRGFRGRLIPFLFSNTPIISSIIFTRASPPTDGPIWASASSLIWSRLVSSLCVCPKFLWRKPKIIAA